jgi:hypothetical protein
MNKSNSVISGILYVFLTVVEVGFEIDDDKDEESVFSPTLKEMS